jgi:hypothetical protein
MKSKEMNITIEIIIERLGDNSLIGGLVKQSSKFIPAPGQKFDIKFTVYDIGTNNFFTERETKSFRDFILKHHHGQFFENVTIVHQNKETKIL